MHVRWHAKGVESFRLSDLPSEAPVTLHRSARGLTAVIVLGSVLMPVTKAFALWDDHLKPFVEEKVTRDDNVFRLSKDVTPEVISKPSRGDTYRTTSLGFNLDLPVSRQRFQAAFTRNDTRYDQLTALNFTGHEGRAVWQWQVGNDASGQLGYTETLALASFANIQSGTPNPLKTQQAFYNADWLLTPRWRIQSGVIGLEQSNGVFQANDVKILISDIALSYVTPANTSVGLGVRSEGGRFPNREFVAGIPFDNAYRQSGVNLVAEWIPTGASRVNARAGRVSRRYGELSQRDFDGNTARIDYDWKPTGKFSLTAVAQRDISVYEDIRTSFVLVKGVTLRPTLRVTDKLDMSGTFEYSVRDYLGDVGGVGGTPNRTDRVRSGAATLSYRPVRALALQISAQREGRSSNVVPNVPAVIPVDYVVNIISIAARITF
jgi:exopolysaccharide biosynthesis operon protein EpsL